MSLGKKDKKHETIFKTKIVIVPLSGSAAAATCLNNPIIFSVLLTSRLNERKIVSVGKKTFLVEILNLV